jgi:hypothetical protein
LPTSNAAPRPITAQKAPAKILVKPLMLKAGCPAMGGAEIAGRADLVLT